jgi:hypothetical protein
MPILSANQAMVELKNSITATNAIIQAATLATIVAAPDAPLDNASTALFADLQNNIRMAQCIYGCSAGFPGYLHKNFVACYVFKCEALLIRLMTIFCKVFLNCRHSSKADFEVLKKQCYNAVSVDIC